MKLQHFIIFRLFQLFILCLSAYSTLLLHLFKPIFPLTIHYRHDMFGYTNYDLATPDKLGKLFHKEPCVVVFFYNQSRAHSLTNQLIKWVKSGVLLLGWNKNLQPQPLPMPVLIPCLYEDQNQVQSWWWTSTCSFFFCVWTQSSTTT